MRLSYSSKNQSQSGVEVWRNGQWLKEHLLFLQRTRVWFPVLTRSSKEPDPLPRLPHGTWVMHMMHIHTCRWNTQHVPCKSCFEPSIMWVLGIEPGSQAWQQALCYPLSHPASPSLVFNECACMSVPRWRQQAALGAGLGFGGVSWLAADTLPSHCSLCFLCHTKSFNHSLPIDSCT